MHQGSSFESDTLCGSIAEKQILAKPFWKLYLRQCFNCIVSFLLFPSLMSLADTVFAVVGIDLSYSHGLYFSGYL